MNFAVKIAEANINRRIAAEATPQSVVGLEIDAHNRMLASLKNARQCSIPGCTAKTTGCHTLQEGGPLRFVAGNGHLMAPKFRPYQGYELKQIGVSQASKAPMFCGHHDTTMFPFERTGGIQTQGDAALQIARSVVREHIVLKLKDEFMPAVMKEKIRSYQQRVARIIGEELRPFGLERHRHLIEVTDLNEHVWKGAEEVILRHGQALTMLDHVLVPALDILQGQSSTSLKVMVIDLPRSMPFAFSGFSSFGTKLGNLPKHPVYNSGHHHHILVAACLPHTAGTKLIIAISHDREDAFRTILDAKGLVEVPVTDEQLKRWEIFTEQLMLSSGDHYFIRQSAYDALDDAKKARLLTMLNQRGALLDDWGAPIF